MIPYDIFVFALGAIIGSFLNVVIHRYPREESIVFPASHCPECGTMIKPWDNIPILSYIILGGRCRACRTWISPRYLFVEAANGLFFLAIFQRTGLSLAFVPVAAIVSMTICLIFIDAEIQILPDVIDLPGIIIGLFIGWFALGRRVDGLVLSSSLLYSALGAAVGASILLLMAKSYKMLRGIEGLGLGDVKMLAMIGAVHGLTSVMGILLVASIAGAIVAVPIALRHREGMQFPIPFGVFLGIASLTVLFFGPTLWRLWLILIAQTM